MNEISKSVIDDAEAFAAAGSSLEETLLVLRTLDTDSFGLLLLDMPNSRWPALSALLPAAAPEDVERHLTGAAGRSLLGRSVSFIRTTAHHFLRQTGRSLSGARVLDFGFGYGRLTRLMLRYCDPGQIYGCDPAPRSLDWATQHRLPGNFAASDTLPKTLPFGSLLFDLVYSFSVFTHLSQEATCIALDSLASRLSPNGMMVITIRPIEFWHLQTAIPEEGRANLIADHSRFGFAFRPHAASTPHYGDTSVSVGWLRTAVPRMIVVGWDWLMNDPNHIVIFMTPSWGFSGRVPT
jgi:SAM-dependent methyltransferase